MSDRHGKLPTQREIALVDILDRALGAGVVITGDITLSLADVDLVYLSLRVLVGSQPLFAGASSSARPTALSLESGNGEQR